MRQFISLQQQIKMNKAKKLIEKVNSAHFDCSLPRCVLGSFTTIWRRSFVPLPPPSPRTTCSSSSPLNALQIGSESRASRLLYVTFNRRTLAWLGLGVVVPPSTDGPMRNEMLVVYEHVLVQLDKRHNDWDRNE